MSPTARLHAAVGVLFAGLLLAGTAYDWAAPRGRFPVERLSRDGYGHGRNASVVSGFLEDTSRLADTLRPRYNDHLFRWTGTASQEVVAGESMLFFRKRVAPNTPGFWDRQREHTVETAKRLRDLLARHGGELFVLVVPDRVRIEPQELPAFAPERTAKGPFYGNLLHDLEEAGIGTIDYLAKVRADDGPPPMQRSDHHWNEHGARLASEAITDHLRERLGPPSEMVRGLERRLLEEDTPGSILRKMGWREESPHYARFHEPNRRHTVVTPGGEPYFEPWDEDIVVVADSFGGYDIAGQTALELGRPVSDMRLGAKGVGATLGPLVEAVTLGWRPRWVVWLFEESGTYGEDDPLRGWLADAPPSTDRPLFGSDVPLDSLEADGGVRLTVNRDPGGTTLTLGEVDRRFRLRLPRSRVAGSHLLLTMRSTSDHRAGFNIASLALVDQARLEAEPQQWIDRRLPLPTERQGRIKLLAFPVPSGTGDLVFVGDLAFLGAEFEILALTDLSREAPAAGAPGQGPRFAPARAERWDPTVLRDVRRTGIEEATEESENGRTRRVFETARSTELRFAEPLPGGDTLDLDVRVLAAEAVAPGAPAPVLTILQIAGMAPHLVYQARVEPDAEGRWRRIRAPLGRFDGESRLSLKWSVPAGLRASVRAQVGFPRDD